MYDGPAVVPVKQPAYLGDVRIFFPQGHDQIVQCVRPFAAAHKIHRFLTQGTFRKGGHMPPQQQQRRFRRQFLKGRRNGARTRHYQS